jgi:hypothetical protein
MLSAARAGRFAGLVYLFIYWRRESPPRLLFPASAQDDDIPRRQAKTRQPLILESRKPCTNALLRGIVPGRNEPPHQARPGFGQRGRTLQ